jgi:recombination protein RecA
MRLDIRRIAAIKDSDSVVGSRAKVKVVKNKVSPPFREAEFDILYGIGISKEGDLLDLGVAQRIVEKSGAWYSFDGERMGQGRENVRNFLRENEDIRQEIENRLRQGLGLPVLDAPAATGDEADSGSVVKMPEKKKGA